VVIVKKKENESVESLLRRFSRKVQQNRVLINARKTMFKEKIPNRNKRRQSAVYKNKARKRREKLVKLGIIEERTDRNRGTFRKSR
jgi:ribosomal protein S21